MALIPIILILTFFSSGICDCFSNCWPSCYCTFCCCEGIWLLSQSKHDIKMIDFATVLSITMGILQEILICFYLQAIASPFHHKIDRFLIRNTTNLNCSVCIFFSSCEKDRFRVILGSIHHLHSGRYHWRYHHSCNRNSNRIDSPSRTDYFYRFPTPPHGQEIQYYDRRPLPRMHDRMLLLLLFDLPK